MEKVSHRSSEDLEWQKTKELCRKRDKNMCIVCRLLTPGEYFLFMKSKPAYLGQIDVAHIESVGSHIEKTYDINNVVCLCRCHHQRIDSMQDLVTGKKMNSTNHSNWWTRIKKYAGITNPTQEN